MIQLNYLYFLIITYFGIKFLCSKHIEVKNPLNKEQSLLLNGTEMFWVLTFSTGLLAFSAPGVIDLMAIRLLVIEILCIIGLFIANKQPIWSFPIMLYVIYLIWILIGCLYSPSPIYGYRVVLKYLYPFIIALFASAVVRNTEVFLKAGLGARMVAVISIAVFFIPYVGKLFPGVFWYGTASAINYISICVFSLALYYYTDEKKRNLIYAILFMIPCFIWVFRTSIMGTALALMAFALFKYRLKALPVIAGILLLFIISIFAIPSVKQKMFNDDKKETITSLNQGEITSDDIDSNGRFEMWKWSLNKFYKGKEIAGSGTGNLQETFYSLHHPFGAIRICHNDYVQILCDNGLIGIVLFGMAFLFLIFHCFKVFQDPSYDTPIHICAIVAGASAAGVLLTMYTDNVINYSMATISYPCGFYGMMLGLIKGFKERN